MKGSSELIIAIAIVFIAVAALTIHFLVPPETPTGKAISSVIVYPSDGYMKKDGGTTSTYFGTVHVDVEHIIDGSGNEVERRAYLRFDLTGQTDFSSAYLSLTKWLGGSSNSCPKLYKVDDYGSLGPDDWDPPNPQLIGYLLCNSSAYADVSNFIVPDTINAFMIKGDLNTDLIEYASVENTGNEPYLELRSGTFDPPTGSDAVPGTNPGEIDLSWNAVEDATYYEIIWAREGYPNEGTLTTSNLIYTHTTPQLPEEEALLHYYRARACNDAGCSSYGPDFTSYPKIGADAGGPYSGTTGENIQLTRTISFAANPSFSWSITSNPSDCTLDGSTTLNSTINCSTSGDRTVQLTVTNADSQTASDTATVAVILPTPDPPTATAGDQRVDLSWSPVSGATYYILVWNTTGSIINYDIIDNITDTSYAHTGLTNGTTYYYALVACDTAGYCSAFSTPNASATPTGGSGPVPPQNVQANPGTNTGQIQITWDAMDGTSQYHVYWSREPDTTGRTNWLGYVNPPVTAATHTTQEPAAKYYYTVRVWDGSAFSDYSSPPASAYPMLGASISGPSSAEIDFTLNGSALYPVGSASYSWSLPSECSSGTTNQADITMSCTTTGTKTITLTVSTAAQGTAQATINIDITSGESIPSIPTGVNAVSGPNTGEVTQTWNPVSGATSYEVVRVLSGGSSWDFYDTTTLTSYVHTTCTSETAYSMDFAVRACNSNGCSDYSSSVSSYPKIGSANANGPYSPAVGETITLNASILCAKLPSYSWSITNNEANCSPTTSAEQNPTINCNSVGESTLTLTVTNPDNQTATDTTTITITETPDTQDPTVQITEPLNNSSVEEITTIKVNASDESGIKNIKFYIDNNLKSTDNTSPFEYDWNTLKETNANHTIKAIAEDAAGNTAQTQITVTVNNVAGPECGNGIIETGEDCEFNAECYALHARGKCNTTTKKHESRTVSCNSCSCITGNWTETNLYCDICNSCGDGTQNCDETETSCPADFGGEQDTTPPNKPTGLETIKTTENSIKIQWNPNTENDLRRYIIYYEKSNGTQQKEIALKNETSLILAGLENNTKYFISMTAIDSSGNESEKSNEISANTKEKAIKVPAPTNLTAEYIKGKVLLEWTHTTPKPDYYIIQRKIKGETFDQIKITPENSYEDKDVNKNKTYVYRIKAFKNGKTSDYSNTTEIKIKAVIKCPTEKNGFCDKECKNDPDCESNLIPWGIGTAIVVVSVALAYILFNFDV